MDSKNLFPSRFFSPIFIIFANPRFFASTTIPLVYFLAPTQPLHCRALDEPEKQEEWAKKEELWVHNKHKGSGVVARWGGGRQLPLRNEMFYHLISFPWNGEWRREPPLIGRHENLSAEGGGIEGHMRRFLRPGGRGEIGEATIFRLPEKKRPGWGKKEKRGRSKRRPPPPPLPAFSSSPCPSPPQSWSGGRGVNRQTLRRATGEKVTRKETEAESGKENAVVYNPVPQKFLTLSFLLTPSPPPREETLTHTDLEDSITRSDKDTRCENAGDSDKKHFFFGIRLQRNTV